MRTRIVILLLFMLCTPGWVSISAQTNKTKVTDTTFNLKYLISSDWNFNFGNLNSFVTVNQGQLNIEQRVIGTKILVRYRYGELEGVVNNNEFYTNADLMLFPANRVYTFANGGVEFSFLRGVNLRAWGGLGAGFKVLNFDDQLFEPSVSFSFEHNNYSAPVLYRGDSLKIINTATVNIGWTGSHKFFKGKLVIVHNYKWTQDIIYAANYKFNGGLTLAVPIFKNFMAKTSIIGSFQNVVPVDKKQGDLIWTIGLAWGNM